MVGAPRVAATRGAKDEHGAASRRIARTSHVDARARCERHVGGFADGSGGHGEGQLHAHRDGAGALGRGAGHERGGDVPGSGTRDAHGAADGHGDRHE